MVFGLTHSLLPNPHSLLFVLVFLACCSDTRGVNLNRMYDAPLFHEHPTVAAIRSQLSQLCQLDSRLTVYIDLHAHATKTGCFVFGNYLVPPALSTVLYVSSLSHTGTYISMYMLEQQDAESHLSNVLFAKLISVNSPYFDFEACDFSEKSMSSKDKSSPHTHSCTPTSMSSHSIRSGMYTVYESQRWCQ